MPCCPGPRDCNDFDPEREGVDEADLARFGGDADNDDDSESRCPECGAGMYHDAALCPRCGLAVTPVPAGLRSRRWVPVAAALAALGLLLGFVILGL